MKEDYFLINIIIYAIYAFYSKKGIVYDGITLKLEYLIQKSIRYQPHHLNYKESLENRLIQNGLKINKRPAIKPVSESFFERWNTMLFTAEKDLVKLLLSESLDVVDSLDKALDKEIRKINPINGAEKKERMEIIARN